MIDLEADVDDMTPEHMMVVAVDAARVRVTVSSHVEAATLAVLDKRSAWPSPTRCSACVMGLKRESEPAHIRAASPGHSGRYRRPLTCTDVVSEGGFEPLAYPLAASADPWLSV